MITFNDCAVISNRLGESGDCTVKAVAVACQVCYEEAHEYLRSLGRKWGRGHHWAANGIGYTERLDKLGIEGEEIEVKSKTVKTLARELTEGHYMVKVKGHVLAIVDGKVEDWTAGRQHRVLKVMKIKNPRKHYAIQSDVIVADTPKGFRKLRHKKAARLGLDPKTGLPLNN